MSDLLNRCAIGRQNLTITLDLRAHGKRKDLANRDQVHVVAIDRNDLRLESVK